MPKHEHTISLTNTDPHRAIAAAYETFRSLGWNILYAGDFQIIGHTTEGEKETVSANVENDMLFFKSESESKSVFSQNKINKKNTELFIAAFEKVNASLSPQAEEEISSALADLRTKTIAVAEQQQKDAEEIQKAMVRHGSSLTVTYALIGINILVFILMAFAGAGIFEPNGFVHIRWGSNFSALTLSGDWWRLITNIFLHFGIIHIVMNMVALYQIGAYLEPMLGKIKFTLAYLCTGVLASLASIWWHKEGTNSAGASGAIFGMYGLFLALLTTDLIPKAVRDSLLKSIGVFVLFNLAYGMKGGIDNAAHIGGLVSGFFIGYMYAMMIKSEQKERSLNWMLPVILIATAGCSYAYLSAHKGSDADNKAIYAEIENQGHKDSKQFDLDMIRFTTLDSTAVEMLNNSAVADEVRIKKLQDSVPPLWNDAENLLSSLQKKEISNNQKERVSLILQYVELRKLEAQNMIRVLKNEPDAEAIFEKTETELKALLQKLNNR